MTEFVRHKGAMRKPVGVKPACVISIGTGWPPPRGVTIFSPQWLYQLVSGDGDGGIKTFPHFQCNYTRKLRYYRSIYYCLIEQVSFCCDHLAFDPPLFADNREQWPPCFALPHVL